MSALLTAALSPLLFNPTYAADGVVVVGGTSKTGIASIRLAASAGYDVVGTVRSIDRAQERYEDNVNWITVDVKQPETIEAAFAGADYIISTVGSWEPSPLAVTSPTARGYAARAKCGIVRHLKGGEMIPRWTMLLCTIAIAACHTGDPQRIPINVLSLNSPAEPGSSEVRLGKGADGTVVMSWLETDGQDAALRYSVLEGGSWQPARTVSEGSNWFINWADFPSVEPISDELWAAHWLVKREGGTYAYDVAVALSEDHGQSWSEPFAPHRDGTPTEHGFVTLFPWRSGVGAVWLDGRNTLGDHGGGMTLRAAVIRADKTLTDEHLIDELICDCCQTDVALGPEGPVAVYRDRDPEEIRDISVVRGVAGGWQAPLTLPGDNWYIPGCPVNGPAVAADGTQLAVAWFTATPERATRVKVAFSSDGGRTFEPAILVDDQRPMGRVDIVLLDDGDAIVSWLRRSGDGKAELSVRRVSSSGLMGATQVVTETGASRPSGFPQMVLAGKHLLFAWTDTLGEESQVRTALVNRTSP